VTPIVDSLFFFRQSHFITKFCNILRLFVLESEDFAFIFIYCYLFVTHITDALALLTLLYESKNKTTKAKDKIKIIAAEIRFMR